MARHPDAELTAIVERAKQLEAEHPNAFGNLLTAIGTNDITRYFPQVKLRPTDPATRKILYAVQRKASGRVRLGLDLQGGMSFLVRLDTNRLSSIEAGVRERALDQTVEVLRRRVDQLGVAEPLIQKAGEDRIEIQLPGLSEARKEEAKDNIRRAAFLEFRMVHPDNDELLQQDIVPPGYVRMQEKPRMRRGQEVRATYLVRKEPERGLTGKYIVSARVGSQQVTGQPEIDFTFNSEGGELFRQITREYSPKGNKYYQLAIVLDGELYSAPQILGEIGKSGQITGVETWEEAISLANALQNPLEAPVTIISESSVDPSLGKDSIRSGITASVIGAIAVALFMLVYYLFAGAVANVALMLNIVILLGVMCFLETTLTLPGIAGVVLTIGMAVDANVLIFERIREELAAGKSIRGGLAAGYDKAFGTIFDTNLTTLIASVILIFMGTGQVKGFGVTLTIGVTVSMFTALVVTRLIFDWLLDTGRLKSLNMLQFVKGTKIDFLQFAKPAFAFSWTLIIVGCAYGIFVRGHNVFGVDFAGGDNMVLAFDESKSKVGVDRLREVVTPAAGGDSLIQYQTSMTPGAPERLRVTTPVEKGEAAFTALTNAFPEAGFSVIGREEVGAVVGREIQFAAVLSVTLALFGILVYVAFRYEFSFAVGTVVAVLHDVLMTLGWFFLSGRQLSAPMVAAILTIIGFSVNDTIVIFDRVREDLKLGVRGRLKDVMNTALNQTLSRTLITSGTVFLATMALFLFGGGVINDFAFTFLVGILTGTYSSIYIASALVLWWHKGERPRIGPSQVPSESAATARA